MKTQLTPPLRLLLLSIVCCFIAAGCSDESATPQRLVACGKFRPEAGYPQITCIYYDEAGNGAVDGVRDEWVVIESRDTMPIAGWSLATGPGMQGHRLAGSIPRRLYVYTHDHPEFAGLANVQSLGFSSDTWLWSDSTHDEARLIDEKGRIIHQFTYTGGKH